MEKSSMEMSLDEWEFLPDNNINQSFFAVSTDDPKESPTLDRDETRLEPTEPESEPEPEPESKCESNRDMVSQVFFKEKEKERQYLDMKIDSPTLSTKMIIPCIETEPVLYKEDESDYKLIQEDTVKSENRGKPCWECVGFNIWKWRVSGIGAICSVGTVAVAAVCILFIGGKQRQKAQHQNQKIQFQIYADDKRIKQVVQQASWLNQAMSAVRGAPVTRASISFGGYYEGL